MKTAQTATERTVLTMEKVVSMYALMKIVMAFHH